MGQSLPALSYRFTTEIPLDQTAMHGMPAVDRSQMVTSRPIRPDDVDRLRRFFGRLSPETIYRRFFTVIVNPSDSCLRYFAEVDGHDREAVVALVDDEIVAVARFDRDKERPRYGEAAVVVEDAWQHSGVGTYVIEALARRAAEEGLEGFVASALAGNEGPVRLARKVAPLVQVAFDGTEVALTIPIPDDVRQAAQRRLLTA